MNSISRQEDSAICALSHGELDEVSGGCFPIPVSDGHGGTVLISPTIGRPPLFPTSTGPTFPTYPGGPFPV